MSTEPSSGTDAESGAGTGSLFGVTVTVTVAGALKPLVAVADPVGERVGPE